MSTVVVNDASCLIDLYKGRLLDAMLTLPYRFVVPLPIRHAEALDLTERDSRRRSWSRRRACPPCCVRR